METLITKSDAYTLTNGNVVCVALVRNSQRGAFIVRIVEADTSGYTEQREHEYTYCNSGLSLGNAINAAFDLAMSCYSQTYAQFRNDELQWRLQA